MYYEEITLDHLEGLASLYVETFNSEPWNDKRTVSTAKKRLQQMINTEHFYHKQNMKTNRGMIFMEKKI